MQRGRATLAAAVIRRLTCVKPVKLLRTPTSRAITSSQLIIKHSWQYTASATQPPFRRTLSRVLPHHQVQGPRFQVQRRPSFGHSFHSRKMAAAPEASFARADDIVRLLRDVKTIAIVGLSSKPERDSHKVAKYLQSKGYRIIPVNPGLKEKVLNEEKYDTLIQAQDAVGQIDLVDVFRAPAAVPAIVDACIKAKMPAVWLQLGVVHPEAAQKARDAGITVVMDRCIKIEHRDRVAQAAM